MTLDASKVTCKTMATKLKPIKNSMPHTHFTEHQVCVTDNPLQEYNENSKKLEPLIRRFKNKTGTSTYNRNQSKKTRSPKQSSVAAEPRKNLPTFCPQAGKQTAPGTTPGGGQKPNGKTSCSLSSRAGNQRNEIERVRTRPKQRIGPTDRASPELGTCGRNQKAPGGLFLLTG
jgi:hypothetical protein